MMHHRDRSIPPGHWDTAANSKPFTVQFTHCLPAAVYKNPTIAQSIGFVEKRFIKSRISLGLSGSELIVTSDLGKTKSSCGHVGLGQATC